MARHLLSVEDGRNIARLVIGNGSLAPYADHPDLGYCGMKRGEDMDDFLKRLYRTGLGLSLGTIFKKAIRGVGLRGAPSGGAVGAALPKMQGVPDVPVP